MANTNIIQARNITAKRGSFMLDIPALDLQTRDSVAVIGPNGCGKSSLLLVLLFLIKHNGTIKYDGKIISGRKDILNYRRSCTFVFQDPLLFNSSVFNNVAYPLKVRGMSKSGLQKAAGEAIERFNLSHLQNRQATRLSGGEAQRVSLARAFAVHPDVIFLDEPFASVDAPSREALISDFKKTLREANAAAFFITHDKDEALSISRKTIIMEHGKIVQSGLTGDLLNNPVNEFTASFAGIDSFIEGVVKENKNGTAIITAAGINIAAVSNAKKGERVVLCIKPENVSISVSGSSTGTSIRNIFEAQIQEISPLSLYYKIKINCGFGLSSYITHESMKKLKLKNGMKIYISFKATSVHLIRK